MSAFASVFAEHKYVVNPQADWWNPSVMFALQGEPVGLITGQRTVDDILNAMDAAWKQGPSRLPSRSTCRAVRDAGVV